MLLLKSSWPILVVIVMAAVAFIQTLMPMANIWLNDETYSHGFIVVPIMIWLLWHIRHEIAETNAKTDFRFYPLILLSVIGWALAELLGIQVLSQAFAVTSMIAAIWFISGLKLSRLIFFPTAFLIFLVPVGDFLVEPMMEFTATFTVGLLKLTGIPVFREGMFFTIPSGNWSVVEACSGVRYIIASVVLGVLFAFLNYRSVTKQIIFIIVSFLIPILANGLRAYMIVMIGHLSNMELATGVDHLIYGWVFFGVVMLILFSVGAIWRDDIPEVQRPEADKTVTFSNVKSVQMGLLVVLVTFIVPVMYVNNQVVTVETSSKPFISDLSTKDWRLCGKLTADPDVDGWQPGIHGASAENRERYCKNDIKVSMFAAWYPYQQQGNEAVNYANRLNPREGDDYAVSKVQSRQFAEIEFEGGKMPVEQAVVMRKGRLYRVWRWYRIGSKPAASDVDAKMLEAYAKLVENRGDALMMVVSTQIEGTQQVSQADKHLNDFVLNMLPGVNAHADKLQQNL